MLRSMPDNKTPMMVAPDRETPGNREKHCAMPTHQACLSSTRSKPCVPRSVSVCSMMRMMTPPTTSAPATVIGPKRCSSIQWCTAKPSAAAGRKAIAMPSTSRRLAGSVGSRCSKSHKRCRK